ncbi:conserved hypothetical protein [Hoeflea sp. EC-HK425]|nr:conserved hypothetical protein [Hoeflea sp. EC-HK425]
MPQDRVVTDRHAQPMHQVFGRATAHLVPNQTYDLGHPHCSMRIGQSNLGQTICERSPLAFPVSTLPPDQREFDFHHLTLNRQVPEAAVVPTMPVPTSHTAIRANADGFRSGGNNPIFFILKGDTQNSDPRAGRPFRFRLHHRR